MPEPAGGPKSAAYFVERLEKRIARRSEQTVDVSPERWAYREAAAVLVTFDLTTLRGVGMPKSLAMPSEFLSDTAPASGSAQPLCRMLNADVRKEALARLRKRDAIAEALQANPDRKLDAFQLQYEEWLAGTPPKLEDQKYADLMQSAQIAEWMEGILPGVPGPAEVRALLNRRTVYALFEHLGSENFTGRERELAVLRDYVGVLEPRSLKERLGRQYTQWKNEVRRPPLVITGAGGIGKSALLGKFLTDHASVDEGARFPFAYLPFDNPFLRVDEPFTLIAEMRRQLQLLHPGRDELFARFDSENLEYRRQRRMLEERAREGTVLQRLGALQETDLTLVEFFAVVVNALCARDGNTVNAPFLLVLDTFEEAQYRGSERLIGMMRMLAALQRMCRTLRIVICTRPPFRAEMPSELAGPQLLELKELERPEAQTMLQRLGVSDAKLSETVARQVGGNPLNLRLAAHLVAQDAADAKGIKGVQSTSYLLFSLSAEKIRAQLYARILQHIHNPEVRALAHPGMVLRRVDAALIKDVLARPCGVEVPTRARADELLMELSKEHTLLEPAEEGALRYRADIRQAVLAMLQQDRPAKVREIHKAAVTFYSAIDEPQARAEELYHRLALNDSASMLNDRWVPSAAALLLGAMDELPPRAQAWLAARVGVDPPAGAREHASAEEWEQVVGRKVRDLLRYTESEGALKLLAERKSRIPSSPLYALEAKALMFQDRYDQALAVLQRGIDSGAQAPNRGRLAELLWLSAQVCERTGDITGAARALERGEVVAQNIADALCQLQFIAQQLLLRADRRAHFETDDQVVLRNRLVTVFKRLSAADLDRERSLARIALTLIGPSDINEFARGIRAVGAGPIDDSAREQLSAAIAAATTQLPENAELAAVLRDFRERSADVPQLVQRCQQIPAARSAIAPVLHDILKRQPHSLSAANLSGIDEYREGWELEITQAAS